MVFGDNKNKGLFEIIGDALDIGRMDKAPHNLRKKMFENATGNVVNKVSENINGNLKSIVKDVFSNVGISEKNKAIYGDVIGVERTGYEHYGIFLYEHSIIHFASKTGDFGSNIVIHETTLINFLDGAKEYFTLDFPEKYDKPTKRRVLGSNEIADLDFGKIIKASNYHLYNPSETIERAKSRLGETGYNLVRKNCEHFAIWCKTGISESHQVNDLLGDIRKKSLSI